MRRAAAQHLARAREALDRRAGHRLLTSPRALFDERRMHLCMREERMLRLTEAKLAQVRGDVTRRAAQIEALSPLSVLSRGYAMVTDGQNKQVISTVGRLREGDAVRLRFVDGQASAHITSVHPDATIKGDEYGNCKA